MIVDGSGGRGAGVRDGQIVLVRHARPVIDPERPAGAWRLDPAANEDVRRLAASLGEWGVDGIIASPEPKAAATAGGIGRALGLTVGIDDRLREQGNDTVPWMDPDTFRVTVERHFRAPDEVVMGTESSVSAADRFGEAVEAALSCWRRPVVVTHGRVMTAWCARIAGVDAVRFWHGLAMPDAWVVDRDARRCWRVGERGNG